jgi:hypothetical protein
MSLAHFYGNDFDFITTYLISVLIIRAKSKWTMYLKTWTILEKNIPWDSQSHFFSHPFLNPISGLGLSDVGINFVILVVVVVLVAVVAIVIVT